MYKKARNTILGFLLVVVFASTALARPVTITYWGWISPEWVATYRDFEEQHPNIKIKEALISQEWASSAEKFLAAVAGGNAPDVSLQNSHQFAQFASQGVFRPIDAYVERDQIEKTDWFLPQWEGAFFSGKQFGLPGVTDTRVMFWNKALFREAGLDPDMAPGNGKELELVSRKLTKTDDHGRITQYGFIPTIETGMPGAGNAFAWTWLMSTGAPFVNSDGTQYVVDDPRHIEALDWVVSFFDEYAGGAEQASAFLQAGAGSAQDPFLTQRLAIKVDGDWSIYNIATIPDLDVGVGPIPIPDMPSSERMTFSCGSMYAISANSRYPDEAWTFMKWLTGPEGAKSYAANCLRQRQKDWDRQQLPGKPVYAPNLYNNRGAVKVLEELYLPGLNAFGKEAYKTCIESLEYTQSCAGLTGTGWGLTGLAFYNEMSDAFQQAVYHKKTPQEALEYAASRLNVDLNEAWKKVKME